MHDMEERPSSRRRWSPVGACLGCLVVGFLLAAGAVLVNWPTLKRLAGSATAAFHDLQAVQTAVAKQYRTPRVSVNAKRNMGVHGSTLSIVIVNSPLLRDLPESVAKEKALAVAALARDTLASRATYQHFEVILSTSTGAGISFTTTQSFVFEPSDLPPSPPPTRQ